MTKRKYKKGAVLIEVMVSLFITAMVFVAVYTTISISLVNTRYLQQTKETSGFASQLAEAFYACAESDAYTMFDYISETHTDVPGATEIDLRTVQQEMNAARQSGKDVAHIDDMISEVDMTDYYAGTEQLPGVEETREAAIRHSVITALKSVSSMKIVVRDGEQFIESPKAGAQYGYKYYYKIGRVNTERLDSTESALGNDEVYRYYVWLDRTGGVVGGTTTPKQSKDTNSFYVALDSLTGFEFGFGARDVSKIMTVIELDGKQSYTVCGATKTPRIFGKGTYTLSFYYDGSLFKSVTAEITAAGMEYINAA